MSLSAEQLDQLRSIGLSIDRIGRIWHQGQEVTHPRLRRAILGWLDVRDDGRDIVRLDDTRYAFVDIEDAHLRAVSARQEGERILLVLDDGAEEELAYETLTLAGGDGLGCRVRGGRLRARLSTAAQQALAPFVVEDPASPSGFALETGGRRWPIGIG